MSTITKNSPSSIVRKVIVWTAIAVVVSLLAIKFARRS